MAWLGLAIVSGGVAYFGALGIAAVRAGSGIAALIVGGFAVCCACYVAALASTFLVSATRYTSVSATGTTLRVNPLIAWLYAVALAGAIVSTSVYLVFAGKEDVRPLLGSTGSGAITR